MDGLDAEIGLDGIIEDDAVWTLDTLESDEIVWASDNIFSKGVIVCSSKGWITVDSNFDEVLG